MVIVHEEAETKTWREHQRGLWTAPYDYVVLDAIFREVELRVPRRAIEIDWRINTHTERKLQVGVNIPLILQVEAQLAGLHGCCPIRGARNADIRMVPLPNVRRVVEQRREATRIVPLSVGVCEESVLNMIELVVGT